ncbi:MAG: Hsp20/alpha crystallin family protein [Bacteroidales bacterium]|nr:Hsp20/alpha crystallin family protein [Bacteroidales bacterium]
MMPTIYSTRNQGWFPTLFNDFFDDNWIPAMKYRSKTPAINVSEDKNEYKVEIAAPGMTKDDFKIQLTNNDEIVISMEKKTETKEGNEESKDEKKTYLRQEFSYSKFEQRFSLPDHVEKSRITAGMTDGVLTISIPKKTEEEKAKETLTIEIK